MKLRLFLTLAACLLSSFSMGFSQERTPDGKIRCHTVESDIAHRAANPKLESPSEFEQWLAPLVREYEAQATYANGRAVTTIPIIFHVIHDNEAVGSGDNLSAALINAQITQLNNDFRKIAGTSGANSNAVGADTEVEFCAATIDENGITMSEPGINRVNRNSKGWTAPPYGTCNPNFNDAYIEGTIKPQSGWDPTKYLNIWVCDLNCGILGYAQFPSSSGLGGLNSNGGSANTDGVVVIPSSVGSTTSPNPAGGSYNKGRTLTHEIGHWIGLRHIWGDGGCGVDDFCNDTPTSDAANYGCPTTHTSCGSTDMVQNYMDYTDDDCMNIFTQDQKSRMQTVLANSPRRVELVTSDRCGSGGGGGGECSSTVSSFPYSEGFESSFGAWTQDTNDDLDWTRQSGGTPSSNTGPSSAAAGSFYAFVEASSPNNPNKTARLTSPCFDLSAASTATFSFQYHMYGAAAMGNLLVEVSDDNGSSWSTEFNQSGNQGNQWNAGSVNLSGYLGSTIQVRFVTTTGSTWQGDVSIDDVELSTSGGGGGGNACTGGITSFPYNTTFESNLGGWTQGSGDDFDWARRSGTTPSSNTGPSSASEGSFYCYIESSSPNYSTKEAALNSPCFDLSGESTANFSFSYHMYGAAAMGGLELQASVDNGSTWSNVWSESGNQGNAWLSATVSLAAYTGGSVQLRFLGTTGTTWQGDMAIDDLSLTTSGGGGGGCTNVSLAITLDQYPSETSWTITNSSGTTVASGSGYSTANGSVNETACLPAGCYDLNFFDSYGDGICCTYGNGSYTLTSSAGTLASGGSFTSSETTNFCVSGSNRQDASAAAPVRGYGDLSLYPNPTRDLLNFNFNSELDGAARIQVTDLTGKILMAKSFEMHAGENQNLIQVNTLPQGTYLILLNSEQGTLSRRFVVMK